MTNARWLALAILVLGLVVGVVLSRVGRSIPLEHSALPGYGLHAVREWVDVGGSDAVDLWLLSDLFGQVEPCNCRLSNPGGLAEQVGILQDARRRGATPAVLYAGNLFPLRRAAPGNDPWIDEWRRLKAETIVHLLESVSPTVLCPGREDLESYTDQIAKLARALPGRILCSNFRDPVVTNRVECVAGGVTVEIASVVMARGPLWDDPVEVLERMGWCRSSSSKTMRFLVVIRGPDTDRAETARLISELDPYVPVMLCGSRQRVVATGSRAAPVVATRPLGQEWGVLGARFIRTDVAWAPVAIVRSLSKFASSVPEGDLAVRFRAELQDQSTQLDSRNVYSFDTVPIVGEAPSDPRMAELLRGYRASLQSLLHESARKPVSRSGLYQGGEACASCHREIAEFWNTTDHSRAFDALQKIGREADPSCLACHTTGFLEPGGFHPAVEGTFNLRNVQCEQCHGPGVEHPRNGTRMRLPEVELCLRCHDSLNSPEFEYGEYARRVGCAQALQDLTEGSTKSR